MKALRVVVRKIFYVYTYVHTYNNLTRFCTYNIQKEQLCFLLAWLICLAR